MASQARRVDLLRTLEILHTHITGALCESVFRERRTVERQRQWTLLALVQFWSSVILRAPASLSQALLDVQEGRDLFVPRIQASPEAFFQRCRDLRWEFFAEVYARFVAQVLPQATPRFCREWSSLREHFTDVLVIDGSQLAPVARRLKILWRERAAIIPGNLFAVYDLFRGIPRQLHFSANAAENEWTRAQQVLDGIQPGSLVLGDRLFATLQVFIALGERHSYGLFRYSKQLGLKRQQCLVKKSHQGGSLQDWVVLAGSGRVLPQQTLRCIRFHKGSKVFQVLTNVLDPKQLPAEDAIELYRSRWTVERLFYDLKEVLNLNRVYPSNPNAVGMQVFSAAIVYTAMRVAQAEIAEQEGLEPEQISPAKFFPKMAAACNSHAIGEFTIEEMFRVNRDRNLKRPDFRKFRWSTVPLHAILVEKRNDHRRKRRDCKARYTWKSFAHVSGGPSLARLS